MQSYRYALVIGLLALAAAPAMAADAITNGGFELAPTAPPTAGDWQYNGGALRDAIAVHTGSFAADLNNQTPGANVNVLQQTPFGSITPGTTYTLSYFTEATYGVAAVGQVQIGFMNSNGNYLAGFPSFTNIPASASYVSGGQSLVAPANASAFFIAFNSVTGAVTGSTSQVYVDDVALTSSVVPEPTTVAAFGLSGLIVKRRRKA